MRTSREGGWRWGHGGALGQAAELVIATERVDLLDRAYQREAAEVSTVSWEHGDVEPACRRNSADSASPLVKQERGAARGALKRLSAGKRVVFELRASKRVRAALRHRGTVAIKLRGRDAAGNLRTAALVVRVKR